MSARRSTGWLGAGLLLCGLVLLGYVGWEFLGTNIVSDRKHREIAAALRQQWREGHDSARVEAGSMRAEALVRIPRFGSEYAVPVLEGTSDRVLAAGFGHFAGTARPGQAGNFALAGHRVTHGEPLRGLPDLRPGDTIEVETRRKVYTYVLDTGGGALVVPFTATWVLDPRPVDPAAGAVGPSPDEHLLTLATCAELFHTDDRMVVFGHLERVEKKVAT